MMPTEPHFLLVEQLREENKRLKQWISDLQSGMYINCVYCGHRYGPDPGTPVAMAEVLKAHVEKCPEHPLSKAMEAGREVFDALTGLAGEIDWVADQLDVETAICASAVDAARNVADEVIARHGELLSPSDDESTQAGRASK